MELRSKDQVTQHLLSEITRFGSIENCVQIDPRDYGRDMHVVFYTAKNRYSIRVKLRGSSEEEENDSGYLRCIASSRTPRAGENWTRGRDLADGSLCYETWHKILADIVSYEMVQIVASPTQTFSPDPEGLGLESRHMQAGLVVKVNGVPVTLVEDATLAMHPDNWSLTKITAGGA